MTTFPLAVGFFMNLLMILWVFVGIVLVFIVLIQKGKGGGLSGAFGGMGASTLFGAKTGDFLTWVTISLAGTFLLLAIILGIFYRPAPSPELDVVPTAQTQPDSTTTPDTPAAPGTPDAPDGETPAVDGAVDAPPVDGGEVIESAPAQPDAAN